MDKKEQILEAAILLFSERGFDSVSVRDLASKAGVNVALINYYFGSKEKLFEAVVEHKASYMKGILTGVVNDKSLTSFEKIQFVISSLLERMFGNPSFHHLLYRELSLKERPVLKDTIIEILMRNTQLIKGIIVDGIKNGEFAEVDAELAVITIYGSISQLLVSEQLTATFLKRKNTAELYMDVKFRKRVADHLGLLMKSFLIKK